MASAQQQKNLVLRIMSYPVSILFLGSGILYFLKAHQIANSFAASTSFSPGRKHYVFAFGAFGTDVLLSILFTVGGLGALELIFSISSSWYYPVVYILIYLSTLSFFTLKTRL
ncbi:hypothetical protein [Pseudovibrio sp. Tun.PSC04-5.I4]|uniref:hypothetical protein n=1 Tax=Pseudovibrio sp. Tun.PSC04-5.I4 TaxID=1798213 RepID=UPI0008904FBA|nr:hypothetical protein [Pseudovibrio sp. Tun.PSC04-5.I4]SDQ94486.1 hypothetical protein SAMN04515695_1999 [Pseudovibrio sp. Tun.PSC04-5.I4]